MTIAKRPPRPVLTAVRVLIGVSLLAYLGASGVIDWSALAGLASRWPLTLAALAVLAGAMVITAARLCILLRPRGLVLSLANSVRLTLIGTFFSFYLPGGAGGDAVRIYYGIAGNEGRRTEVATIMLLDRAAGLFALLALPLLLLPATRGMSGPNPVLDALLLAAALLAATLVAGVVLAWSERFQRLVSASGVLGRLPLGEYALRILDNVHAYRAHRMTLLAAAGISLVAHTLTITVMLILAFTVTPTGPTAAMSALIPFGSLANTLPITPGGLGVGEAAMDGLFRLASLQGGAEVLLGWRVLLFLVGLAGLALYLRGSARLIHASMPVSLDVDAPAHATPARGMPASAG